MDAKTAFLNGFLEEEIYMAQPEGFTIPGQQDLVCKLIKSIYGLKQGPCVWFSKLIKDSCVFIRTIDGVTCYIAVYVDDLSIIAPTRALYATKVINHFSDYIPYPIATPADRNVKLSVSSQPATEAEKDAMKPYLYREAVEIIMYLMVGTRPDMVFYMREVSQFLANPGMEHWNAVVRGLKYLAEVTPENLADRLTANSDSDHANCPDTRRSAGGYFYPMALAQTPHGCLVNDRGRIYRPVSLYARDDFLNLLLRELGFATTQPNLIHEDNQSCIKIRYKPELHGRSKHIHARYCFVQEKVERHEFSVAYCNTKYTVVDIFTKALAKHKFRALRAKLRMKSLDTQ
ncbi:Integrase catalytic core protein [Phytophthora palmivora]|uniref:Integrase catalytic core protein n=1 Tax=Phytophthora palmivora TaxID=4796 RepID=A0A2P4YG42_9STRA|nr:Integrase catalytic core protein [Phytophthora palmivora]